MRVQISATVELDTAAAVNDYAKRNGLSLSQALNLLLETALRVIAQEQKP